MDKGTIKTIIVTVVIIAIFVGYGKRVIIHGGIVINEEN